MKMSAGGGFARGDQEMDERLREAPCGYLSFTHDGTIVEVNRTFLDRMGYRQEELVGKHVESIMSATNKLIFHSYFYPHINLNGHVEELIISLKDSGGQAIPHLLNGRRFERDGAERFDCILVQMGKRIRYEEELQTAKRQIEEAYWEKEQALAKLEQLHLEIERKQSELMEINERLVELSVTDKLTGLKNRRYLQEQLEAHVRAYDEDRRPFSLLLADIDHFKKINDTYGHQMGDRVLERMAGILQAQSRQGDIAARYGGEEFVLVLPGADIAESKAAAERIRQAIAEAAWEVGALTASFGVATVQPEDTEATLLHKADEALYASKAGGRNRVTHRSEM